MSITATTFSGAVDNLETQIPLASVAAIVAPNNTKGGKTFLFAKGELMQVYAAASATTGAGTAPCIRGIGGTKAQAHLSGAPVLVGLVTDFPKFQPAVEAFIAPDLNRYDGFSAPVASATTIVATGKLFHVTGTTATATITPPSNFVEGEIVIIADGVWTWTAAGNIVVAGTVTTAGSAVRFTYDAATAKWSPSRLA